MEYLDKFTKEEIKDRVINFNLEINDTLDLDILFQSFHNLYNGENVILHEDSVQIQELESYDEEYEDYFPLQYFELNDVFIFLPITVNNESLLIIKFVDEWDVDDPDRIAVVEHLTDVLPEMIMVNNFKFVIERENGNLEDVIW